MQTWDAIIVGGGIIGLSLSLALRKRGLHLLVVERGEPGHEASHAAAGMLADCLDETPGALQPLATASARMYPEFVEELHDASGINPDLRDQGTIVLAATHEKDLIDVSRRESCLVTNGLEGSYSPERSVDPRALAAAALQAAKHRAIDIASGTEVTDLLTDGKKVTGVATTRSEYAAPIVVNCAGAWAGKISAHHFPTRPVKGQMLSVAAHNVLQHVVRATDVYLVPRSDGRILIGATVEEAGFDKRTVPDTIRRLRDAAVRLIPRLADARILEDWAGLRPGTPDDLPILGATDTPGYFVATGHFRNGILLAPVTAEAMAELITGSKCSYDLSAFSPSRFS